MEFRIRENVNPSRARVHGLKMTISIDHIVKTIEFNGAKFYMTRIREEHCMPWSKNLRNWTKEVLMCFT